MGTGMGMGVEMGNIISGGCKSVAKGLELWKGFGKRIGEWMDVLCCPLAYLFTYLEAFGLSFGVSMVSVLGNRPE